MKLDFRATKRDEEKAIRTFLTRIFEISPNAPLVDPQHLYWKYYHCREDWSREGISRSFVYAEGADYLAHACAWPFRLLVNGSALNGVHPIDWAASSDIPGLGALLLRQMRTMGDVSCCIGGTDVAQKVIAQSGYRPVGEMKYYSRPLHAFCQFRSHPRRNVKLPARLIRNFFWSHRAGVEAPRGWTADHVAPEQIPAEVLPQSSPRITACERKPELFSYMQQCPVAPHKLYLVRQAGQPSGYFMLSFPPGQVRVVDSWVINNRQEDWKVLYALAVHTAYQTTRAGEIVAASAIANGQSALEGLHFRAHLTLPVMLFDPKKLLTDKPPVHFQMIDNDFSFLHEGKPDYQT